MSRGDTWIWTPSQRRALAVILGIAVILLFIRAWRNPTYLADPLPPMGTQAPVLADKLDPNTATSAMLAALPLLGEKKAAEIVAYRDVFLARHIHRPTFRNAQDLCGVRGIGPATVERLAPYLTFPPATTQPAR